MIARAGLLRLLETLDRLEINYMVVGSTASSIYGFYRATADVDLVVALQADSVSNVVELLRDEFYLDEEQIRRALRAGRAFNVVHLATAFKFDLFPLKTDKYSDSQFSRRRYEHTAIFGGDPIEMALSSPEDVVLNKLSWYKQAGRVSDRQWGDILGVISVKRDVLDLDYLREWAKALGVDDLLESALTERHVGYPD